MSSHKLNAAYGTLRLGHGNYRWAYGSNNVECVAEATTLTGYKMRTHGGYPAIYETGKEEDTVVVDVFDLDTSKLTDPEELMADVDGMEYGAGYEKKEVQLANGMLAWVYTYTQEQAHSHMDQAIESGDWTDYRNREHGIYTREDS